MRVTKMLYKLLIGFEVIPNQPMSDENFNIQLSITNIGDSTFPGGELTYFGVSYGGGLGGVTQSINENALSKVPAIKVNESIKLNPQAFMGLEDGIATVSIEIVATDKAQVSLFQSSAFEMGKRWTNLFRVRNRDTVKIVESLQKIVELLEKGQKQ
jgi:hypothetical protein